MASPPPFPGRKSPEPNPGAPRPARSPAEADGETLCRNPAATIRWGRRLGETVPANRTIALRGNFGDGKTTLASGIAEGWGVAETVKSPTFHYCLSYRGTRGLFLHLDAHRIESPEAYASLLVEELLEEPWLLVVEWADRVEGLLPGPSLDIRLSPVGETARRLAWRPEPGFAVPLP